MGYDMQKNVFAYTAPGFSPMFLSINENQGELQFSVRSAGDGQNVACMTLPPECLENLIQKLQKHLLENDS